MNTSASLSAAGSPDLYVATSHGIMPAANSRKLRNSPPNATRLVMRVSTCSWTSRSSFCFSFSFTRAVVITSPWNISRSSFSISMPASSSCSMLNLPDAGVSSLRTSSRTLSREYFSLRTGSFRSMRSALFVFAFSCLQAASSGLGVSFIRRKGSSETV